MSIEEKEAALIDFLTGLKSFGIAFSGGVDSSLLVAAARQIPSIDFCTIMGVSPVYFSHELERGREFCRRNRVTLYELDPDFFGNASAVRNGIDRCYHCKKSIFALAKQFVLDKGFTYLVDGTNVSDSFEIRPGTEAVNELGIVSPLKECGFEKPEIRELAQKYDIEFYDEPASACLATRIPHGEIITLKKVQTVEKGEMFLRELGLRGHRLRHHGDIARIELRPCDMDRFSDPDFRETVTRELKALGFTYVVVDMEGYKPSD